MLDSRLKYAVAVARIGSFTGAANAVGVTQSAVTKSVADLEQQLGIALFNRTSRGILVTPEGRDFIDRAARLLADADDLFRERNRGADPYAGLLRIGLFPGSMDWLINDAAIGLLKRHEGVRLEIVSGNSERAVQLLSRGDIDVAFGLEAALAGWPQFKCERIAAVDIMPFVRKDHPILSETAIDKQMSTWRDDSQITRFNAASSGEWVPVSPELAHLTARALALGRETGGAFDVTLGPILKVWGFGAGASEPDRLPDADELAAAREKTGIGLVEVREQPPALRKRSPDVTLDLAGLAQGYTVDLLSDRLDALGAKRYLVELGGELYAKGNKHGRSPWRIGVEKPKAGTREIERVVGLADAGMTTSGDYRDYFELDGRRFSHTIDPRTGRPVAHDLRAVTVIAKDALMADAMATALLVMGPQAGLDYANTHDIAALFVSGNAPAYTETYSTAFEPYIEDSK